MSFDTAHFVSPVQKMARKHGKTVTWSSVALAIVGLIIQAIAQHNDSSGNHAAMLNRLTADEARITLLEQQAAYNRGLEDGKHSRK